MTFGAEGQETNQDKNKGFQSSNNNTITEQRIYMQSGKISKIYSAVLMIEQDSDIKGTRCLGSDELVL